MFGFSTGYEPDLYDYRDLQFAAPPRAAALPLRVEGMDDEFPIYDQNGDSACVAFSYKEAAQIVLLVTEKKRVAISAAMLWALGRSALGTMGQNTGCRIRDVVKAANAVGVAPDHVMPWRPGRWSDSPSADALAAAKDHPALGYATVETSMDAKVAVAAGQPIIFGTVLTPSFSRTGTTGLFAKPDGGVVSAHAMTIVGYDDQREFPEWGVTGGLKVRNHWRQAWGLYGYCWMPYAHFDSGAVQDAWTLSAIKV